MSSSSLLTTQSTKSKNGQVDWNTVCLTVLWRGYPLAPVHAPPQGHEASIIILPFPFLKKNIPFQFTKVLKSPLKSAIILVQKDWRISTACMVSCKPCTFPWIKLKRALSDKPQARGLTVPSFQSFFLFIEFLTAPSASQCLRMWVLSDPGAIYKILKRVPQ